MMIKLVTIGPTDFNYSYVKWIFDEYFTFIQFDPSSKYNKNEHIFLISRPDWWHDMIIDRYLNQGVKIILANLWEARPYFLPTKFTDCQNNILVLLGCQNPYDYGWNNVIAVPRWFWYNESLMYTCDDRCCYNTYQPQRTNNKLFLMPMRRNKNFRTQIRERLAPFLKHAIYSYVETWDNPVNLPRYTESMIEKTVPDRVFEPNWYNNTYFSVAVETAVDRQLDMEAERIGLRTEAFPCDTFVTEKTFKPIAFSHPFLVCGMPGTLKFLQDNGFETYNNLFDESYDSLPFFEDRLDMIYNNIADFSVDKYNDSLTEQKILHNRNHFYDRTRILELFKKDIIEPLLKFNES